MSPLKWYEGNKVVQDKVDKATITKKLTDKTLSFIDENKSNPFVYLPYTAHVPLDASSV